MHRRLRFFRFPLAVLAIIACIAIFGLYDRQEMSSTVAPMTPSTKPTFQIQPIRKFSSTKKVILSWTMFCGIFLDDKYFNSCPELRQICDLTINRSRYAEADAIVFHPPDVKNWSDVPAHRWSDQRYVFLMHEAPATRSWFSLDPGPSFFNWSMTYRMDSDIPYPYGFLVPSNSARQELDTIAILNKTKSVVWFVSNCETQSKREIYVEHLKKYISVDIYGYCGLPNCSKYVNAAGYSDVAPCEKEMIHKEYKFYIAFENSICRDYITEKFLARRHFNSVPIVLSRRIVESFLPPKSFIAADDFPSGPKELAEYLKHLMENDEEYLQYFEWKKVGYSAVNRHPFTGMQWGFCGLCEKLWRLDRSQQKESKVYGSLLAWWGGKVACDNNLVDRLILKRQQ